MKKWLFLSILFLLPAMIFGCGSQRHPESDFLEDFTNIYMDVTTTDSLSDIEAMKTLIEKLGKKGYVAVDSENQIDLTEAEQVWAFCRAVDEKKNAKLTIIEATYMGGFRKYDLSTENGKVDVTREYYEYGSNGIFELKNIAGYYADFWIYTEEGYLLFEGNYYSEESYVLTLSEASEHVAIRVSPLEEKCRELNRTYILPVGYRRNNLFLTDWSEKDFGDVNFYDLFDVFYPLLYKQPVPYVMGTDLSVDTIYRIPKGEFENVIMPYFRIDEEVLQSKTAYLAKDRVYQYRPRGLSEADYSDIPYPEVVAYTEKSDGTIELTVNAVYPNDHTSKAFSHKVVIRPLDDGSFRYVSNQMIFPEEEYEAWWHGERFFPDILCSS